MNESYDITIIGTGVAGCYAALQLPSSCSVLIITKAREEESDSFLAQGGICIKKDDRDREAFIEDTIKAGHYENNVRSVEIMVDSSPRVIEELIELGVRFDRIGDGFSMTREGGHSTNRILHYQDTTGKEITSKLLNKVKQKDNIKLMTSTAMVDILSKDNTCYGIVAETDNGEYVQIKSQCTIFATGGIGGIYQNSTNYGHLTGDAIALALQKNIKVKDIDYLQIHPTTLYTGKKGKSFLISESVRGEGAVLLDKKGERFVEELMPRDSVTNAIFAQMKKDRMPHVWLSMKNMDGTDISERFPTIYKKCIEEGYDPDREYIPVVPAQHYLMGGIEADINGRTSMERLYAVGETANIGVHGANRLASNSLLESMVFAKRSAIDISKRRNANDTRSFIIDDREYADKEKLYRNRSRSLLEAIEIERKKRKQRWIK